MIPDRSRNDCPVAGQILIVDDDRAVRQLVSHVLQAEGYAVQMAASGWEARDRINASIDLVLLDLQMPGLDGWETFQSLVCKFPALPIILITARSNQIFPAMATGVDALFEKPLDLDKLLAVIDTLLKESVEARAARTKRRPFGFAFNPPKANAFGGTSDHLP